MGLFDFVKDAGEKLFKSEEAEAAPDVKTTNEYRSMELLHFIAKLGFVVEDLNTKVDGDVATVKGTVPDQSTKERIVLAVGNTAGIGQVNDQLIVSAPEPEAVFYTVKSGDSLSKIAKAHYGDAGKYPTIFEANKPLLSDPNKIYPGQVLRIPPIEE